MIVASIRIADGEADADLLGQLVAGEGEGAEDGDHHERRARHDAGRAPDAVGHRVVVAHAALNGFADAAEDEDVVVHREAEQDHEQEQRDPGRDAADRLEVEQLLAVAVLEDQHEHAVGGADRQQVERDRLDRHHDRAERDQQQHEREAEHEAEHDRRPRDQDVDEVLGPAVTPFTATSAPASLPTVAGTTSARNASTDASKAPSVPLPLTESPTTATVLSGLISTREGSDSPPVAIAWSCSSRSRPGPPGR